MSPSGAWRRRARRPSSPPDAPAGRGLASRRRAASSARPGPRAARSLRRGLRSVLAAAPLALALLAGLPAGAQAQTVFTTPTFGIAGGASTNEGSTEFSCTIARFDALTSRPTLNCLRQPDRRLPGVRTGRQPAGHRAGGGRELECRHPL